MTREELAHWAHRAAAAEDVIRIAEKAKALGLPYQALLDAAQKDMELVMAAMGQPLTEAERAGAAVQ